MKRNAMQCGVFWGAVALAGGWDVHADEAGISSLSYYADVFDGAGMDAGNYLASVHREPASRSLAGQGGNTSSSVGLFDIVSMAVGSHPSIESSIGNVLRQEGLVDVARSGYYPQLSAGFNSGRLSSHGTSQVATLSLSQMLYDFGKVRGRVGQAEGLARKQKALVLSQVDSVALQAAEAAIMVHRYQVLQVIAKEQIAAVRKVHEMAESRAGSGLASQSDPVQARTRVDSARANLFEIETSLSEWRERLRLLTNGPSEQWVAPIPENLEFVAKLDVPVDYNALPEVIAANSEWQAAQSELESAKAQRYPTFAVEASSNQALSGVNPNNGEDQGSFNTIMLTGSSFLYQGGAISAQIRAANAGMAAAESLMAEAKLNAEERIAKAREQIRGAKKRLAVLVQRQKSMLETRELYKEQYTLGSRSVLDLLNAEQEVYLATADKEDSRHSLWMGVVNYIAASGRSREAYALNGKTIHGVEVQR
ncbi:TolC family outer membrane protein [Zestomonas carbonaria]|nr:TolC family outer membrane protein [Pseudomonas carbonaria]